MVVFVYSSNFFPKWSLDFGKVYKIIGMNTFSSFVSIQSRLAIFQKFFPDASFDTTLFKGIEASFSHVMR